MINNLLPTVNAVAFALTCRTLSCALLDGLSRKESRELKGSKRTRLLELLQRDYEPGYGFCSDICSRLHRLPQWRTSLECASSLYWWREENWRSNWRNNGSWELGDWWNIGRIGYHDAHQVMLGYRLGEGYGRPLSSLFTSTDWVKLDLWFGKSWKGSWTTESNVVNQSVLHSYIKVDTAARIVNNRLILRYTQRIWVPVDFQDPQWPDAIKNISGLCLKPSQRPQFDTFMFSLWVDKRVGRLSEGGATRHRRCLGYQVRGYHHGGHGFELVWDTARDLGHCDPLKPTNYYIERLEREGLGPKTLKETWDGWGPFNPVSHSEYRHPSSSAVLDDWRQRGLVTSDLSPTIVRMTQHYWH